MSYSGDAAEQVVRMSLEGGEVAIKLAGAGAKQLAILLYAILREQKKTKGKTRLTNMLRSGKELKVFAVKDSDLQLFCREAKKYGVLYCVLKDRDATDGITDIMVRAEDASKINRIFERFDLATVDMAEIKSEIERDRAEKTGEDIAAPEQAMSEQEKDAFLDELFQPAPTREEGRTQNPFTGTPQDLSALRGEEAQGSERRSPRSGERSGADFAMTKGRVKKSRQSEPTSKPNEPAAPGISEPQERSRPSVRQELKDIKAEQRQNAADKGREKSKGQKPAQHKAPPKKKSKKQKER